MNLARNLEASAYFFPDRPAIREGELTLSYARLNALANRAARGLVRMGVLPGEHVGLCAPNSADWIVLYFAVLKAGAVAVTFSALLHDEELTLLVKHARPKTIFTHETRLPVLAPLRKSGAIGSIVCAGGDMDFSGLLEMGGGEEFKALDRERRDTAAILYTGGTTGTPKGVMLTHEGIDYSASIIACFERSTEQDTALCFMPFNHVFGQIHVMNSTIYSAGCLEMLPSFDLTRILELTGNGRVTKFYSVPTVYARLLAIDDLRKKLGNVRYCFSAGASIAMEIVRKWKETTGITISESYGQTEAMPITYNHYYPERHVVGSVGHPVHGVEVKIMDIMGTELPSDQDGEICVRGPVVMNGYLDNPDATASAFHPGGWLRTGDIGRFDAKGYLYIVDRLKELIITGGENVYPREVEEALYAKPEVQECAVVGVPDKEWGERVIAFIIPNPGHEVSPEDVKTFLKARLAPFKVPKEYLVRTEFPKSPAGKILKRELRKEYMESPGKQ